MVESPMRILVVDDEEVVQETIGFYLRGCGHTVESARTGNEGLGAALKNGYDLVITDLRMPGLDGMSLLDRVLAVHPETPVAMMTAYGTAETVIEALRRGATDFLLKPIKLRELDSILENCRRAHALHKKRGIFRETIRKIRSSAHRKASPARLIGNSAATCKVREQIRQAVEMKCDTILIRGETGVGKEVVARQIHF